MNQLSIPLEEARMKHCRPIGMFLGLLGFLMGAAAGYAQLPPAAEILPAGFTLEGENNLGGSIIIDARKPNNNFPKPHMDQGITLRISWMKQPAADQVLSMVAAQPEDPAGQSPGSATREEPCGKQTYRDGVLLCRKVIIPWIGAGSGPDLETWRINWTGKGQEGLVGVEINNFYGAKEAAMAWIDAIIPRIVTGK
jgi:hypothetical protein